MKFGCDKNITNPDISFLTVKDDMSRFVTFYTRLSSQSACLAGSAMLYMCPCRPWTSSLGGDGLQSGSVCLNQACFRVFKEV